jgi:formylglycine-generating enzyme required for sulfatase activity
MKKSIILFAAVCCALCACGQTPPKIALYMSGDGDISIKKVFGSKLAEAITRNGEFKAVDHTADFDAEVKKQQGFNHKVTSEDIFALTLEKVPEVRFGAQFLCMVIVEGSSAAVAVFNRALESLGVSDGQAIGSIADLDKASKSLAAQVAGFAAGRESEQSKRGRRGRAKDSEKDRTEPQEPAPTSPLDGSQLFNMAYVPGGTFMMGCPDGPNVCEKDEKPAHRVTVSDFYISATEVTYAQWKEVTGSYPDRNFKGDATLPVTVSWLETQDFLGKLSVRTGAKYRLPTEAEWEYAARGGSQSKNYRYSGSNDVDEVAWYADNSGRKAHIAGGKQANELGLYDMGGNMWEWCRDRYEKYSAEEQADPVVTDAGKNRVIRGGGWDAKREDMRTVRRASANPEARFRNIGFRVVLNADK